MIVIFDDWKVNAKYCTLRDQMRLVIRAQVKERLQFEKFLAPKNKILIQLSADN